jgi:hypothetical protein
MLVVVTCTPASQFSCGNMSYMPCTALRAKQPTLPHNTRQLNRKQGKHQMAAKP